MSETITIYCKNNNTYKEVPIGSSLLDIYSLVGAPLRLRPMNAQVNNKTEGLTFRCWHPKDVEYVDYTQLSGMRTYVRSLCHIFSKAVNDVLPSATLNLEHPISKGYYCVIHNGKCNYRTIFYHLCRSALAVRPKGPARGGGAPLSHNGD